MGVAAIKDAFDASNNFMLNEEQRLAYINREMSIMDYNTNMRVSREEGVKDGISQMVLDLLKAKQPVSFISQISKFSPEQISDIAKKNGISFL